VIALCAPYRRNYKTQVALSIARQLDFRGKEYVYFVLGQRAKNVDPEYDHRVATIFDGKVNKLSIATHVIWLEAKSFLIEETRHCDKVVNMLLADWGSLDLETAAVMDGYGRVFVPTQKQGFALKNLVEFQPQ
jgi:hypothetical protein